MAVDLATLNQRLSEAEAAKHKLLIGQAVVTLRDQNGETVTYQQASIAKLDAYIAYLQQQIDQLNGVCRPAGPLTVWF